MAPQTKPEAEANSDNFMIVLPLNSRQYRAGDLTVR